MNSVAWLYLTLFALEPTRQVDFDTEIIPVLTKSGCNAGACHGAAAGRGGFHLSLLGSDPAADHEAIAHALEGRRINLAQPERSLFLRKPTGQIDHGGDVALDEAGPGAKRIMAWIRAGATRTTTPRRLTSLEITPHRLIVSNVPATVPLQAIARFDDGPPEDVSPWTVFVTSDPAAVEITAEFAAHIRRRGQHVVTARFLDRVVPIQFNVPLSDEPVDLAGEPRENFIDDEVLRLLTELRVPVSPPTSDAAYLRRVTLDLTGRLPEPLAVDAFLAESSPDKRARLVDALLSSDAFAQYWTLRFARLLRVHSLPNEVEGVRAYAAWLRGELGRGTGFDQLARQLLTATGDSHVVGPANFGRMVTDARGHAELVGQFFLGVRLGCANCHNHPLDKWTQDDYHGLAAVFARLDRGRKVRVTPRGAVTNLRTNDPAIPRLPGERYLSVDGDHREQFAQWLTAGDSRYFARASVNRLWRAMLGRGLIEPTDDLRDTNPPTHPDLLERLADDFVSQGYNLRHSLRLIALSGTYARGAATIPGNASDDRFYSHALRRPLEPEVLADALADVTGVANEFAKRTAGGRAVELIDPLVPAPSLDLLGRCSRAAGCDEAVSSRTGLPAQLHLLNGDLINLKLTSEQGRLHQLLAAGSSNEQIVDEFYVRALSRHATNDERSRWRERLETSDHVERRRRLEDFVWSMLNSRSFMENQ